MLKLHRFRAALFGLLLSQGAVCALLPVVTVQAQTLPSVLVLNVTEDSHSQDDLRTYVSKVVVKTGAHLVDPPTMSSEVRDCAEPTCMSALAAQHRVELILTARIERTKGGRSDRTRVVKMWLYNARTEGRLEQKFCRPDLLEDCLGQLAQQLIGMPLLSAAAETTFAKSSIEKPSGKDTSRSAASFHLRPWRIGLALGLGALAVGSLGTAVGLQQLQGHPASRGACTFGNNMICAYELTPAFVTGYVTAAAFAVGATLTFFVPGAGRVRR